MGWGIGRVFGKIGSGVVALGRGETWSKIGGGIKHAGGAAWSGLKGAGSYVVNNPVRILNAGRAIVTSVPPLCIPELIFDRERKVREMALVGQGALRGVTSVAGLGASAVKGTINGVSYLGHDPADGEWSKPITADWSGWMMEQTDKTGVINWIEQENLRKYGTAELTEDQKAILYGAQGVTEVAAFVALGGGVGAVAGGASATARTGAQLIMHGSRAGAATTIRGGARAGFNRGVGIMNPLNLNGRANQAVTALEVVAVPWSMNASTNRYNQEIGDRRQRDANAACEAELRQGNFNAAACSAEALGIDQDETEPRTTQGAFNDNAELPSEPQQSAMQALGPAAVLGGSATLLAAATQLNGNVKAVALAIGLAGLAYAAIKMFNHASGADGGRNAPSQNATSQRTLGRAMAGAGTATHAQRLNPELTSVGENDNARILHADNDRIPVTPDEVTLEAG